MFNKVVPDAMAWHRQAKFAMTVSQKRFHLWISLKALCEHTHTVANSLRSLPITVALERSPLMIEGPPLFDEAVGAKLWIVTDFGLGLHGADRALCPAMCSFADKGRIALEGAIQIARRMGSNSIQRGAGPLLGLPLMRQHRKLLFLHAGYRELRA